MDRRVRRQDDAGHRALPPLARLGSLGEPVPGAHAPGSRRYRRWRGLGLWVNLYPALTRRAHGASAAGAAGAFSGATLACTGDNLSVASVVHRRQSFGWFGGSDPTCPFPVPVLAIRESKLRSSGSALSPARQRRVGEGKRNPSRVSGDSTALEPTRMRPLPAPATIFRLLRW